MNKILIILISSILISCAPSNKEVQSEPKHIPEKTISIEKRDNTKIKVKNRAKEILKIVLGGINK
ncbi:MAG: hypothetical protein HKN86_04865 [Acidimicrobiia bacterium]|nr:hypothetical protein [Acidimicrobiia bacterium]